MMRRLAAAALTRTAKLLAACGEICTAAANAIAEHECLDDINVRYDMSTREGRAAAAAELNAKRYR